MCLCTRRSEPGEHRALCGGGGPAGARGGSELRDQQRRDQRGGRKLPHQRRGSSNDHQGNVHDTRIIMLQTDDLDGRKGENSGARDGLSDARRTRRGHAAASWQRDVCN